MEEQTDGQCNPLGGKKIIIQSILPLYASWVYNSFNEYSDKDCRKAYSGYYIWHFKMIWVTFMEGCPYVKKHNFMYGGITWKVIFKYSEPFQLQCSPIGRNITALFVSTVIILEKWMTLTAKRRWTSSLEAKFKKTRILFF